MEVRNNQTCPAAAVATFLRKFKKPGNALLPASRPRTLARALILFFIHSFSLLGIFGVVEDPLALPVKAVTIVDMIRPIEVKTAVMVNPCSLNTSFSFSRRLRSSSRIFSTVWRIRENCEANSLQFCDKSSNLTARSSFRSVRISLALSS